MRERTGRKRKKRSAVLGAALVIQQLVLTAVVLLVFAFFHHVLPYLQSGWTLHKEPPHEATQKREQIQTAPAAPTLPAELSEERETAEQETPGLRFREHFSENPVYTEDSYTSSDISVTVTRYEHPEEYPELTYFVADIYLADIKSLITAGSLSQTYSSAKEIAGENGAIVAINGDGMLPRHKGFTVRNGEVKTAGWKTLDICVLFEDGTIETFGPEEYTVEEILEKKPLQVWQFGPSLLDREGKPRESFNIGWQLQSEHPRTALGYYEPGHYCFVVVDGRQGAYSTGADISTLARLMSSLGCVTAYNLDGGASSRMVFNGETVNQPYGERFLSDMLIIAETGDAEVEEP